jgi:hypothetical protein
MKKTKLIRPALLAAIACLAATAFAQGPVTSSTGASVTSGTGVVVNPASAAANANARTTVMVTPSTSVAVPSANLLPGGAMVQYGSTTVLGGPSGDASGTKTEINSYWVNVPPDANRDDRFRRWQQLR